MTLSKTNAVILIISSILGYGMLTMPHAFAHVGLAYGTGLLAVLSIITALSVYLIFESAVHLKKKNATYFDLTDIPYLNYISNLFIFLSGYFACISYFKRIVIWTRLIFDGNELIVVFTFSIFHLVLTIFLKSLKKLNHASILSAAALSILFIYLIYLYTYSKDINMTVSNVSVESVYGIFVFSLTCQNFVLGVFNELDTQNYIPVIAFSIFGGFLLCFLIGFFGFSIAGIKTREGQYQDILTFLFHNGYRSTVLLFVMFSYIILLNCSYLFQLFPSRNAFLDNFNRIFNVQLNKIIFDISWVATVTASYFFETGKLLNLQGLIIGNSICYILPGIAFINIRGRERPVEFCIALLLICFGVGSMTYSLIKLFA